MKCGLCRKKKIPNCKVCNDCAREIYIAYQYYHQMNDLAAIMLIKEISEAVKLSKDLQNNDRASGQEETK